MTYFLFLWLLCVIILVEMELIMEKFTLAIEMGSSNTVIYKLGDGIVLKEATILAVESAGNKNRVVAVGDTVKKMSVLPKNVSVMHPVENGVITDVDLASTLLKKFLEKIEAIIVLFMLDYVINWI